MVDRLIALGLLAALVALVWFGWWLSRPAPPKRPGVYRKDWGR